MLYGKDSSFDIIEYVLCTVVWKRREIFSIMYEQEDRWMMEQVFHLSDSAVIHMVNRLFRTEYREEAGVLRETDCRQEGARASLTIGGTDRYEFRLWHTGNSLRIYAENRGCIFYASEWPVDSVVQVREPHIVYFGKNIKEESYTVLEFPGHEKIRLPIESLTLEDYSPDGLQEAGLVLFLPFLLYRFLEEEGSRKKMQDSLKYFLIHDIVGALSCSARMGEITVFDAQRLKQLCRNMAWRLFSHKKWMQDVEMQGLFMEKLDADVELLDRVHRMELQRLKDHGNN